MRRRPRSSEWAAASHPDARVGDLPAAEKSIVAIARAIAVKCDLLVLDEPTAALPEADVARLLDVLRRLRDAGLGIVYVSHRLDEVFRIADRVTVLRDGRRITTELVADTTPAALVRNIVGRALSNLFVRSSASGGGTVLRVELLVVARTWDRFPSMSPPARSSGWSDCAAPGTMSSGGQSSATFRSLLAPFR